MAKFTRNALRRKTQWAGFGDSAGAAVLPVVFQLATGTPVVVSQAAVVAGSTGFVDEEVTVTRVLGHVMAGIRVATANAAVTIAIGCAIVRLEALAAGVASLPSPEDDPDYEWLYYNVFPLANPVGTGIHDGWPGASLVMPFDVRGQRIVRRGMTFVWLAESQGGNAFAGVGGRYLVKLP